MRRARALLVFLVALTAGAQVPYWAEFSRWEHPVELAAQVRQESGFRPNLTSPVGAQGICQFMPGTWREAINRGWARPGDSPWDAPASIQAQAGYMGYLRGLFRDDWPKALAAYNCGEGRLQRIEKRVLGPWNPRHARAPRVACAGT